MEYEHKKRFLINSAFVSVWLIIGYIITKFMVSFLLPFVIALLISFFSNKAASAIGQKTGLKSDWLKFALLLLFYLVAILTAGVVIFLIIKHSGSFFSTVKDYITSPDNLFTKITQGISEKALLLPENLKNTLPVMLDNLSQKLMVAVTDIASAFTVELAKFLPRFFISSVVMVVSSFYITKDYDRLLKFLRLMIGDNRFSVLKRIKAILTGSVLRIFSGYLILSAITFVITLIAFFCFSVKHAALFAFIVAFIDLLPVLGAGTVLIPMTIYNFLVGKSTLAWLLLFLYILITLLRNFLEPKLLSHKLNISPLLMLLTLFIGLRVGGIAGMLLLPVTVVVVITYYRDYDL